MRPVSVAARIACVALLAAAAGQGCSRVSQDARADSPPSATRLTTTPVAEDDSQTLDEMLARSMNRFARLDLDGDGRVTQDELSAAETAAPAGGNATAARQGDSGFARADANRDGVVTRAEMQAQTRERFKRLDANKDGVVTREEELAGFDRLRPGAVADGQ